MKKRLNAVWLLDYTLYSVWAYRISFWYLFLEHEFTVVDMIDRRLERSAYFEDHVYKHLQTIFSRVSSINKQYIHVLVPITATFLQRLTFFLSAYLHCYNEAAG